MSLILRLSCISLKSVAPKCLSVEYLIFPIEVKNVLIKAQNIAEMDKNTVRRFENSLVLY